MSASESQYKFHFILLKHLFTTKIMPKGELLTKPFQSIQPQPLSCLMTLLAMG